MEVVEAPRLSNRSAPDGALVLVTPDPVYSVAGLKDPEATAAAERLRPPTMLAFIQMATNVDWTRHPSQQPLSFTFNFVLRSLPKPRFAFIPLSEEAAQYHPSGRAPLIPSTPLPWSDCFLYTMDTFVARVSRIFLADPGKICQLSREQRRTVLRKYVEDIQTPNPDKPPRPRKTAPPPSPEPSDDHEKESPRVRMQQLQASDPPNGELQDSDATSGSTDDEEGSSDEGSSDNESEHPRELVSSAEIRLDLSLVQEVGTFDDYVEYMMQLYRIEREWANRTLLRELANQPDTQLWANNVADATEGHSEAGGGETFPEAQSSLDLPAGREKISASPKPGDEASEPLASEGAEPSMPPPRRSRLSSLTVSVSKRLKLALATVKLLPTKLRKKQRGS